jgi:hypothetical protein
LSKNEYCERGGKGMDNNVVIGAIGLVCTVAASYASYQKGLKKESKDDGKENGVLMSDIGYIKAGVDDLKRKQETSETRHYALAERVTKVEESAKQAHLRINEIRKE